MDWRLLLRSDARLPHKLSGGWSGDAGLGRAHLEGRTRPGTSYKNREGELVFPEFVGNRPALHVIADESLDNCPAS